ncbi:SIR2_2 domain-containing protein (plasmid) [Rhodovastum atsumiense]|uniref:SIR2 family anti-phage-associated protein n=1 Tax=Rhodovastum atsumiense TaxID=504468 RepID=UPI00139F2B02|nr:SIR2 family anti-phage-associated protein [Rhodovastum atsumiense]CAH2606114.1 SIR2_2 domain-containing protein [Rhodovastum atsumiense]
MSSDFYAVRGTRKLGEEEFRAHLALCTRLENIAVLLGAGASVGVGGRTMPALWDDFSAVSPASVNWLRGEGFLTAATGDTENVEFLLDRIELADMEWSRAGRHTELAILRIHRAELRRAVLRAALLDEASWTAPETPAANPRMRDHMLLLARLVANRQPGQAAPWVFTTNYDLAIEWAAETLGLQVVNGFSGLHLRRFNAASYDLALTHATARGEARFGTYHVYLAKLHGSLSWRALADGSVVENSSSAQWPLMSAFLEGKTEDWPGLLIFPGAAKFVQTTGFVYGEVIRRLTDFASRPNTALLVCGYGFGDDHLNRILLSVLQNPTAQIVVYLPEAKDRLQLPGAPPPTKPFPNGHPVHHLLGLGLPQVTVVGAGARAYFGEFVGDLPEPALMDDLASGAHALQRAIQRLEAPSPPPVGLTA